MADSRGAPARVAHAASVAPRTAAAITRFMKNPDASAIAPCSMDAGIHVKLGMSAFTGIEAGPHGGLADDAFAGRRLITYGNGRRGAKRRLRRRSDTVVGRDVFFGLSCGPGRAFVSFGRRGRHGLCLFGFHLTPMSRMGV